MRPKSEYIVLVNHDQSCPVARQRIGEEKTININQIVHCCIFSRIARVPSKFLVRRVSITYRSSIPENPPLNFRLTTPGNKTREMPRRDRYNKTSSILMSSSSSSSERASGFGAAASSAGFGREATML